MANQWIFQRNWAMRVSKCFIYCKNKAGPNPKYQIIFYFVDGEEYSVEFADPRTRDNHFKFFVRMMHQNYATPYSTYFHWTIHAICLCVIWYITLFICNY